MRPRRPAGSSLEVKGPSWANPSPKPKPKPKPNPNPNPNPNPDQVKGSSWKKLQPFMQAAC
eukprot:scaffold99578_cov57-Phaeocystis_antarctica.AAC.3